MKKVVTLPVSWMKICTSSTTLHDQSENETGVTASIIRMPCFQICRWLNNSFNQGLLKTKSRLVRLYGVGSWLCNSQLRVCSLVASTDMPWLHLEYSARNEKAVSCNSTEKSCLLLPANVRCKLLVARFRYTVQYSAYDLAIFRKECWCAIQSGSFK